MSKRFAMLALVAMPAISATAAEVTVTYLGGLDAFPAIEFTTMADCIYGNTVQPGHILDPDELTFSLGLAVTFDPMGYDCPCDVGFTVEALHMVVVKTVDYDVSDTMNLAIGDAYPRNHWPPEQDCFSPTGCAYNSYWYGHYCIGEGVATFGPVGYYEVVFTEDFDSCDCIYSDYTQTIVSYFPIFSEFSVRPVTDVNPEHCPDSAGFTSWHGSCFWEPFEAPGNLVWWAEISCCETPVRTDSVSWSTVKALYR